MAKLPRDSRRYRWQVATLAWLGAGWIRLLGRTWRVSTQGTDPLRATGPRVGALWHQGLLAAAWLWRDRRFAVPVSRSRDGDLMDAVLQRLGYAESPRGSSSRGATSLLRELIRRVRGGEIVGMLPDGPRGPAGSAKPGVVALCRATGAALHPVGVAASPAVRFGSWDRALLPLPFARVRIHFGEPLHVPKETSGEELEKVRAELEARLDAAQEAARATLGRAA